MKFEHRFLSMIGDQIGVEEERLTLDQPFSHYDLDSFDVLQMVMAVEDRFDVEITDDEASRLTSFRDLYELLT